jgi:sulfur carrier protein
VTEPHPAEITVNGSARTLVPGQTVTDLVAELTGRRIAADSQWAATALTPGDDIEIVTAVQGG